MRRHSRTAFAAVVTAAALTITGCSGAEESTGGEDNAASASDTAQAENAVTVEDNYGSKEVPSPPKRVVALDNRSFELLDEWGVKPVAAARALVPVTIPGIADDEDIVDIGNHREPKLEAIVAAEPDVIVSGQRFEKYDQDIEKLAPDAVLVDFEPREGESLDAELIRQTEALGTIFGKEAEAEQTIQDFKDALERAKKAYDPEQKVMAVNVSGGEIGYVAPSLGRVWGPLFDLLGMTPALEVDNASDDHQGDDISVEAIASANPDWILALDRDAAIKTEDSPAALSVLADSAALQNVKAIQEDHVYVAPNDTYTNESIITYTEILNELAEKFEAA